MIHTALLSRSTNSVRRERSALAAALVAIGVWPVITARSAQARLRECAARTIARTMGNPEFRPKTFRGGTWFGSGDAYLDIRPSASGTGSDIVKYETATGAREVFVAASRLIPTGEKTPLNVEEYSISPDGHRVLIFTNSKTVWRRNTRGDYWVLELASGA